MEELIKITEEKGNQVVSAQELHSFFEVGSDFSTWIKRMFEYGFEEDKDFSQIVGKRAGTSLPKNGEQKKGGQNKIDYALTLDCAKEISMLQRSEKGKTARKYFIECEKKLKEGNAPKILTAKELALLVIKAEEEKEQAIMMLEQANDTIIKQAPAVRYVNEVLQAENTHTTTTIAKELGLGAPTLNQMLKDRGVQYSHEGHWVLYHKYQGRGFTKTKTHTYTNTEGKTCTSIQTVWTETGRRFIHEIIRTIQKSA